MTFAEVEGESYLAADMSLLCFDERWDKYAVVAAVGIALYPLVLTPASSIPHTLMPLYLLTLLLL